MTYSDERINEVSIGYDLDLGGYAFERSRIGERNVLVLDGGIEYVLGESHNCAAFLAFDPAEMSEVDWPVIGDVDGVYVPRERGWMYDTDHDCICHGRMVDGEWEYTGSVTDEPHPDCDRCEGTGFVDCPGGPWALYYYVEVSFDGLLDAIEWEDDYRTDTLGLTECRGMTRADYVAECS